MNYGDLTIQASARAREPLPPLLRRSNFAALSLQDRHHDPDSCAGAKSLGPSGKIGYKERGLRGRLVGIEMGQVLELSQCPFSVLHSAPFRALVYSR